MPRLFPAFLTALAFLSRLAPARVVPAAILARSVPLYPLAGAVIAVVALLPALLVSFSAPHPWLAAWLYVISLLWLTRGLHWDGLADIADALGSNKTGDEFHAVLKDSRVGAFGAMTIAAVLSGQIILSAECLSQESFAPLIFAPLWARAMIQLLARTTRPHPQASLGKLILPGTKNPGFLLSLGCSAVAGLLLLPPATFGLALLFSLPGLLFLRRLAQRRGGLNGDYFGALVVSTETAALLAGALG